MAALSEPPDLFVGAGGDLSWQQDFVLSGMPLCGEPGDYGGKIVNSLLALLPAAHWAGKLSLQERVDGLIPRMARFAMPPDLDFRARHYFRWKDALTVVS